MRLRRHLLALAAATAAMAAALIISQPETVWAAPAVTTGTITIAVDVDPASGQDFDFTGCLGGDCGTFSLDDDTDPALPDRITATDLAPGTYTITQDAVPGWDLTALRCTSYSGVTRDLVNRRLTITVASGSNRTCTFENTSPSISISQDTKPDQGQDYRPGDRHPCRRREPHLHVHPPADAHTSD